MTASGSFALIETLRWEPAAGFLRGERHLSRLAASASRLGFSFDRAAVEATMNEAVAGETALRVRVELAKDGTASVTAAPFAPLPEAAVWRLRVAATRVDSGEKLLRHKTTRRGVYETARAEYPGDDVDEVILLNERGEVCEGTITNVFLRAKADGVMTTPPASCGLLPGVLRGELLDTGAAVEASINAGMLRAAAEIFVGNSLRGLIRAELA